MDMQKKFLVWFFFMALSACAVKPQQVSEMGAANQQLIARDLVGVLAQIQQISARNTTLTLPDKYFGGNDFAAALKSRLEAEGYGIRTVDNIDAQWVVSYSVESSVNAAGRTVNTYTVAVDRFGVRRSYELFDAGQLRPVALMQVKGADAASLRLNDDLFAVNEKNPVPVKTPIVGVSEVDVQARTNSIAPIVAANPPVQSTRNVRELGRSNFAELLSSYLIVDEAILLFANDSVRLGQVNKVRVSEFVSMFDSDSDVFLVTGCSNGATAVDGGPKALAMGRGERVRQELLYAGVPDESIRYEGCWSDEYYDELMPRRAVVLSLNRRAE